MNKAYVILPDVTCDLSKEICERYDIETISGHVKYPNGREELTTLDWDDCSFIMEPTAEEFYTKLRRKPTGFTTAPASAYEYYNAFENYVKQGYGILSMSMSSKMSGTYNFATQAKNMILEKYPAAEIRCFDSMRFGAGFGLMAIWASDLRREGKTLDEVVKLLEDNKTRFHQASCLDDFSFLRKKGRISRSNAFFSALVGTKSLGEFNSQGVTTVIGKAIGGRSAYTAIIQYIDQTIESPDEQAIIIANSNRRWQAEVLRGLIEAKFHPKEIYVTDIYPACGINVGPGLTAVYYAGKPLSEDLTEEKELMSDILRGKS